MFRHRPLILNQPSTPSQDLVSSLSADVLAQAKALKAQVLTKALSYGDAHAQLNSLTHFLWAFPLDSLTPVDRAQAFWINVYNTLIIHGVIALKIEKKVVHAPAFFKRVSYQIQNHVYSLDIIEHGILRNNAGHPIRLGLPQLLPFDSRRRYVLDLDPRVHFALNCGARSCPPIRSYQADELDQQLSLATQSFLSQGVRIDEEKREIWLSKLFLWYPRDFGKNWPQRVLWIANQCQNPELARTLKEAGSWKRRFDDYDWTLA
jgi:hypothetical protein